MKKLLIVFALLFALPSFADNLEEYVQLLKTDLKAQSREIISKGMQTFTDEEAKRFWPIYESYMAERGKFLEARVAVIKAYADDYDTMTDAKAQELLNRRFEQIKLRNKLDEKFRSQFATALSPRRLVRLLPDSARTRGAERTQGGFANPEDEVVARRVKETRGTLQELRLVCPRRSWRIVRFLKWTSSNVKLSPW